MLEIADEGLKKYPKSESIWINKGLAYLNLQMNEEFKDCQ